MSSRSGHANFEDHRTVRPACREARAREIVGRHGPAIDGQGGERTIVGMDHSPQHVFVGRLPGGGIIRHGDPRGLPGSRERIAAVAAKNQAAAARCRAELAALRRA